MTDLSEDDLKLLVNFLNKLSFKLDDAALLLPIIDKLKKEIKEPDLAPTNDIDVKGVVIGG